MADFHFTMNEKEYVVDDFYLQYLIKNGIKEDRTAELLAVSLDKNITLTKDYIKNLNTAEHRGKAPEFINNYKYLGNLKVPFHYKEETKTLLENAFRDRYGRAPQIIDSISVAADFCQKYEKSIHGFVDYFNLNAVRAMLQSGIPPVQVALLYNRYSPDKCMQFAANNKYTEDICSLLAKGIKKDIDSYMAAADWIAEHLDTNEKIIEKIVKNPDQFHINENLTVDGIKAQFVNLKAFKEKEKVEKAYKKPRFKLSECTCELRDVQKEVLDGRLMAYIMHPQDERQLILGHVTNCCQKLGDAGESSMMHGLLNPKAGFFVIQDQRTGEIKAQAEIWEENENTLVFDNIEYANDCDISLYKDILGKWLTETSYLNVKMGTGYNGLTNEASFRYCGSVTPTITAREAYVMSYEDEIGIPGDREELECLESEEKAAELIASGDITYYTYLYCDSENEAVWLKESGIVEEYFIPETPLAHAIKSNHDRVSQMYDNIFLVNPDGYNISKLNVILEFADLYKRFISDQITIEQFQMTNMPIFVGTIETLDGSYIDGITISYQDLIPMLNHTVESLEENFTHYLEQKISRYQPITITIENDDCGIEIDFDL